MLVDMNGIKYCKVDLIPVSQKGNTFYIGVVNSKYLIDTFTVEPVEYDVEKEKAIRQAYPNISEYLENSLLEKEQMLSRKGLAWKLGFQRKYDATRVKKIGNFLYEEDYPFFPNSIIATCDLINNITGYEGQFSPEAFNEIGPNSNLSYLETSNTNHSYLYFPLVPKSILVIDGQHRLEGLKRASQQYGLLLDNTGFDLIVSFMLDYDRSVIAKLFYTINYTQKSVNKSVLYHLTGEFSRELNQLAFLHETVKALNEIPNSPFFDRIKMLGRIPDQMNIESQNRRELMTISQASLIDSLMYTIVNKKAKSIIQPIFYYYYKTNNHDVIIDFLLTFFSCIRRIIPAWNYPRESIISKTAGVGALTRLMNHVFLSIFDKHNLYDNPLKLKSILEQEKSILSMDDTEKTGEISIFLSKLSDCTWERFAGDSSAGTLNKIKTYLVQTAYNIPSSEYDAFEAHFKKEYAVPFAEWLERVT